MYSWLSLIDCLGISPLSVNAPDFATETIYREVVLITSLVFFPAGVSALKPGSKQPPIIAEGINSCDTATLDTNSSHYYLGYRSEDLKTPWAEHFRTPDTPATNEFRNGVLISPLAAELGVSLLEAPLLLQKPGYLPLENGWTVLPDGTLYVATLSDMGHVTGEMLDFWFYWHANCSSKYKMWNPHAHRYAWVKRKDLSVETMKNMNYRERYWDNTSFVNEYIGDISGDLSIGFFDPRLYGFALSTPDDDSGIETVVTAFVEPNRFVDIRPNRRAARGAHGFGPLQIVLMHQLRKKPDGSGQHEMRSRFWIGAVVAAGMRVIGTDPRDFGHDMAVHCHIEMTHLGKILPSVFQAFKDDVW